MSRSREAICLSRPRAKMVPNLKNPWAARWSLPALAATSVLEHAGGLLNVPLPSPAGFPSLGTKLARALEKGRLERFRASGALHEEGPQTGRQVRAAPRGGEWNHDCNCPLHRRPVPATRRRCWLSLHCRSCPPSDVRRGCLGTHFVETALHSKGSMPRVCSERHARSQAAPNRCGIREARRCREMVS